MGTEEISKMQETNNEIAKTENKKMLAKRDTRQPFPVLRKMLSKIKHPYYYVPQCPVCGSRITGRLVKDHRNTDIEWVIQTALKHGELVRPMPELPPYADAFCAVCQNEWFAGVHLHWMTAEEIQQEKKIRGTTYMLARMRQEEIDKNRTRKKTPVVDDLKKFIKI